MVIAVKCSGCRSQVFADSKLARISACWVHLSCTCQNCGQGMTLELTAQEFFDLTTKGEINGL